MKRILITGANSYIGTSVEKWLLREPDQYAVDTIDMEDPSWKQTDFSPYDVVFHVAGIAHVSSDPKMEDLYFKVNRDLTVETASKAKAASVKQFIFMSSIIVYGDSGKENRVIDRHTKPVPSNFYGQSKLEAEQGISKLEDENFRVVILRPPMIYGKGSKGNYPKLARLAKMTPIFPDYDNKRSMLHIDNLCEFIKLMIDNEESGLFSPQNSEYVQTSEMVRTIAEVHGKKIWFTRIFNPVIRSLIGRVDVFTKVFGNLTYDPNISSYVVDYRIRDLKTSIEIVESGE